MEIHTGKLTDVDRYISNKQELTLDWYRPFFETCLRQAEKYGPLNSESRMLEVGTGTGYFLIYCAERGLHCEGLEISQQLIDSAIERGRKHGVEIKIHLANIETSDLGENVYDHVMCSSVFEHVEDWRKGLRNVYRCLKPGGSMFFESTNKFSLVSGEYSRIPLYGWLPDSMRYALRKKVHGPDIMQLGIDFHQFRYPLLRREFRKIGFRGVYDRVDLSDVAVFTSPLKEKLMHMARTNPLLRSAILTFAETTRFICVK